MTPNHQVDDSLAALSAGQREKAMTRFELLKPHLEEGVPLPQVASDAGIALRTAKRWLARYRARGLAGLVRIVRSDAGHRKLIPKLIDLIEGMALRKPQPSVATLYRRIIAIAKEHGWSPPSYGCVYSVVRTLNPAMITLAHEGQSAFRDRFELIYRHRADLPNAI